MPRPRVVVFGYGPLALAALDTLERLGVAPVGVVVPGNRRGADVDLVAARATSDGVPLLVQPPRKAIPPFLDAVDRLQPDLLLVWSYSMLLSPELIARARLGAVNVHGGLLPEYRGGHVMNWAIANGEQETGTTLAYLDDGIDTGPVIAERRFPIEWRDDAVSVREKLRAAGETLLETWWPSIENGTAPKVPQDESRARYHRMRTAEDGRIDWSSTNIAIYNLVRALAAPWPGGFSGVGDTRIVLRRVEPVDVVGAAAPGTVIQCDADGIIVAAGSGAVRLVACEIDGMPVGLSELQRAGVASGVRLA
jgi:UDP-4-amino-4-deoxy-L-arabinose formyltransferase/UDP-glucuronic acid dehydrogenase (UDP-4-keto-hexauronic acid decarboxylating)